jgi:hypothetical protein
LAEKADISNNEAGAANIAADADAAGDDIAINKDSEGSSLTKKGPSEESNAPFAGKYNFGTGFDATSDGFGDATGINGWDATIDKLAHSNTMICNKESKGFDDDFGYSFDDPFGSNEKEKIQDKDKG